MASDSAVHVHWCIATPASTKTEPFVVSPHCILYAERLGHLTRSHALWLPAHAMRTSRLITVVASVHRALLLYGNGRMSTVVCGTLIYSSFYAPTARFFHTILALDKDDSTVAPNDSVYIAFLPS